MMHQDWKEVILQKHDPKATPRKHIELSKAVKLENDTENLSNKVVGLSLGKQIQTARLARGMKTQKELAVMISVRPEIITKYENGSAIPDTNVLQKLRKALGTKLKA